MAGRLRRFHDLQDRCPQGPGLHPPPGRAPPPGPNPPRSRDHRHPRM